MVVAPALIPTTRPPVTLATLPAEELHVPPPVASLRMSDEPVHTTNVPVALVIAEGAGLTVIGVVMLQPVASDVKVMVAVPTALPVTVPPASIEAVAEGALAHVPGALASESTVVPKRHTPELPLIGEGNRLTVIEVEVEQPPGTVTLTVPEPPGVDPPVTIPVEGSTVTSPVEDHVPPGVPSDSVMVLPGHTDTRPTIGVGGTVMVTEPVTEQVPTV